MNPFRSSQDDDDELAEAASLEFEEEDDEDDSSAGEDIEDEELEALAEEARALCDEGEYRKAIRLWKKSLDRFSDEPSAFIQYADAIHQLVAAEAGANGDEWMDDPKLLATVQDALEALGSAIEMDEEATEAWNIIGRLHALSGNNEAAAEAFRESLDIDDSQRDVRGELDEVEQALGESE